MKPVKLMFIMFMILYLTTDEIKHNFLDYRIEGRTSKIDTSQWDASEQQ